MRNTRFKMSIVMLAAGLVLVALVAGVASLTTRSAGAQPAVQPPAPQQPNTQQPPSAQGTRPHPVIGTITSASDGTITVTGRDGSAVTVTTTATTRILGRANAALTNVKAGDAVHVLADKAQDGSLTATAVEDVPAALGVPMRGKGGQTQTRGGRTLVSGTVAEVRGGVLSVTAADGSLTAVTIPQTARIGTLIALTPDRLVTGARVTVLGPRNADGGVTATLIMVAAQRAQ
ncbi:MAG TPA: DUF5666 domain-containing protein [bacterium]|nr:DUF5666 domain-containing protein [bacterium]